MDSETITSGLTISLKIDLPCIPRTLKREQCYCGPIREKVANEKYFRQAIFIYNKKGNYLDSGFVQINNYMDTCKMIRVLPKNKVKLHAFDRWEHYDSDFFKTDKYNIYDYNCSILILYLSFGCIVIILIKIFN